MIKFKLKEICKDVPRLSELKRSFTAEQWLGNLEPIKTFMGDNYDFKVEDDFLFTFNKALKKWSDYKLPITCWLCKDWIGSIFISYDDQIKGYYEVDND